MENVIKKRIAEIIKRALFEKDMKQTELAKKLGVSRNVIAQWVNGRNLPPGDKIIMLVKELDIVPDIFPGYKKVEDTESEDIRQALMEMRKKMDQIENQLGMKGDIMIHQNNNHQAIGNVSVGKD